MTEKEVKKSEVAETAEPKAEKAPKKAEVNFDKFAVIKTGGKQYVVHEGRYYDFEKLEGEEGKEVKFEEVLLTADGDKVVVGTPLVEGVKVTGKILSQFKDDKVLVFKYKKRKRYRKTQGHRQQKTKVLINKIS